MKTVRIDDDLYEMSVKASPAGVSTTRFINDVLRSSLTAGPAEVKQVKQAKKPAIKKRQKTVPVDDARSNTGKCDRHPPGRVLDGVCMACGHKA